MTDKEAILKKAYDFIQNKSWYITNDENEPVDKVVYPRDAKKAIQIVDEYAASLRKERDELRAEMNLRNDYYESKIEMLNRINIADQSSNEAKEKEIERLKKLLEFHLKSMYDGVEDIDTFWQQFKAKNNL